MEEVATVFVVDDDPVVRALISAVMESTPNPVKGFESAQSFLDFYQPGMPGCLVSDIMMPDINGLELQQMLKSRAFDIPVIFISGYGNISIAKEALKQGALDFSRNPLNSRS